MRVAPVALYSKPDSLEALKTLDREGAEIAAITHGHPLGYLPAAVMTHIISLGVYGEARYTLPEAVKEAWTATQELFQDIVAEKYLQSLEALITKAMELAKAPGEDEAHIRAIGEGWVGDEALAIALYCCLRYPDDFSKAVIAAVNHSGDSDSTGAIAGNILGAWLGYAAIEEKWLFALEMKGLLLKVADDLCDCRQIQDSETSFNEAWMKKYSS